jgi:hypothetical protein
MMHLSLMPSFNFLKDFRQPFDGYNAFFFRISVTLLHPLCVCVCVCACVSIPLHFSLLRSRSEAHV